jgi:hypothetical protein
MTSYLGSREFITGSHLWIRENAPLWWRCMECLDITGMVDTNRLRNVLDFLKLPRCDDHPRELLVACTSMIKLLRARHAFSSTRKKSKPVKPCCICGSNTLTTISVGCGHFFHHSCLQSHSELSSHCPVCLDKFRLPRMLPGKYGFGEWGQVVRIGTGIDSHLFVNHLGKVDTRVPVGPFNAMRDLLMYARDRIERKKVAKNKRVGEIMSFTNSVSSNTLTRVVKILIGVSNISEEELYNVHESTVAEVLSVWLISGHHEEYSEIFVPFNCSDTIELSDFDSECSAEFVNISDDDEVLIPLEQYLLEVGKGEHGIENRRWNALRECIKGNSTGERIRLINGFITGSVEFLNIRFKPDSFMISDTVLPFRPFPTKCPPILAPMPSELLSHYNSVHDIMTANFGKHWRNLPVDTIDLLTRVDDVLSLCQSLDTGIPPLDQNQYALLRHRVIHAALRSKQ